MAPLLGEFSATLSRADSDRPTYAQVGDRPPSNHRSGRAEYVNDLQEACPGLLLGKRGTHGRTSELETYISDLLHENIKKTAAVETEPTISTDYSSIYLKNPWFLLRTFVLFVEEFRVVSIL